MLQVLFAVEQQLQSYQEKKKKSTEKKRKAGKEQWKSLSTFDWLKRLKQKAGKFSIKKAVHFKHATFEPDKTKKWIKTMQDKEFLRSGSQMDEDSRNKTQESVTIY